MQIKINRIYEGSYFQKRGVSKEVFDLFFLGTAVDKNLEPFLFNVPVFPLYNFLGELVGVSFRPGTKNHKYYHKFFKKSQILYGLPFAYPYILQKNYVIITEGFFDVLLAFTKGVRNVVGILGNTMSKYQIGILASYTDKFVFALDSDNGGLNGLKKSEMLVKKMFPNITIETFPIYPYKDLGEYYYEKDNII